MSILSLLIVCLVLFVIIIILSHSALSSYKLNNIVIVFSKGYSKENLNIFLFTLKRVSRNSFLLIFSDSETISHTKTILNNEKVIGIEFFDEYPYYKIDNQHYKIDKNIPTFINRTHKYFYHTIRYFLMNLWIKKYGYLYKSILICDIKDILFQNNPFTFFIKKGVYLQQEVYIRKNRGGIIADECNTRWIKPYNASSDILKEPIINSGQIFGTSYELKKFISEFCNFMNNTRIKTAEQGSLNYFVYSRNFSYKIYLKKHGYGYALLLHYPIPFTKDNFTPKNNFLYNFDKTIPPIVHSYIHGLWHGSEKRKRKYKQYIEYHSKL